MALKDRLNKIDFSALPGATADPAATVQQEARPARTAPGAMVAVANDRRSEMLKENERLKGLVGRTEEIQGQLEATLGELRQWDGARATRALDPAKIRLSRYANRHPENFKTKDFAELRKEIRDAGGNVQPIKVRTIKGEDGEELFELVYGIRRRQACEEEGLLVNALVDNVDDQTLFIEMDRENRHRKDLSAWEQGVSYRNALSTGLFPSIKKLAEGLGVDMGNVSRAISLADLPPDVLAAFPSPLSLQFRWAKPLKDAIEADSNRVVEEARAIGAMVPKPNANAVFARLTGPTAPSAKHPVEVQVEGKTVARLSPGKKGAASLEIESGALPAARFAAFAKHVEAFFKKAQK